MAMYYSNDCLIVLLLDNLIFSFLFAHYNWVLESFAPVTAFPKSHSVDCPQDGNRCFGGENYFYSQKLV